MFMERASSQVIASNIAVGDNRSLAGGRYWNDWVWAGGYVTGPTTGAIHSASSLNPPGASEQLGAFTRVAFQLVNEKEYSFHIGGDALFLLSPSINRVTGLKTLNLNDRPELRIDPTSLISANISGSAAIGQVSGAQVYSAEVAGNYGPLYVQGEYFHYNIDRLAGFQSLQFDGGYIQAGWTITGETRNYNPNVGAYGGIAPHDPFSFSSSGSGAWEIAGRYSVIDLNDRLGFTDGVAGGRQTVYTAGLNWYVNRNVRFMFNYLHGVIDRSSSVTVVNNNLGSKFDAVAMRTQVAF
jgi:phosphate-selective porin OprO/OprP